MDLTRVQDAQRRRSIGQVLGGWGRSLFYGARRGAGEVADLITGANLPKTGTDKAVHEHYARNLTRTLGNNLPVSPENAANLVDSFGLVNEAIPGALRYLSDGRFFADNGFDWEDVAANRRAEDEAIREINADKLQRAQRLDEVRRALTGGNEPI